MNNNPIGVFDSGIGGLTVVKEIVKQLPNEHIIYLGDTARVPYGPRSKEIVIQFAKEIVAFLLKRKVKALVVACNTISSFALPEIKKLTDISVLGVVKPAAQEAVNKSKDKKIGVIGTTGTINSKAYEEEVKKIDSNIEVISVACPLFVPLAEEGLHSHPGSKLIAQDYLNDIKNAGVDTLILGCTHYPLLLQTIADTLGSDITLIDPAIPTTQDLVKLLTDKDQLAEKSNAKLEIFVTDAPERVYKVASRFFGEDLVGKIQKVTL